MAGAPGKNGVGKGSGSFSEKQNQGIFIFAFASLYFLIVPQLCNSFFIFESDQLFNWDLSGNPGCLGPDWLFELGRTLTGLWALLRNASNKVAL